MANQTKAATKATTTTKTATKPQLMVAALPRKAGSNARHNILVENDGQMAVVARSLSNSEVKAFLEGFNTGYDEAAASE